MLRATEGLAEPPSPRIEMRHFQTAMQRITPSVSLKVFLAYHTCLPTAGGFCGDMVLIHRAELW